MYSRNGHYKKFVGNVKSSIRKVTKGSVPPKPSQPSAIINPISLPVSSAIQAIAIQQPQPVPVIEDIIQPQTVEPIETSAQTQESENSVEGNAENNNNAVDAIEEINNVNVAAVDNAPVSLPTQVESIVEVNVNPEQKEVEGQVSDEKFDNEDWVELEPGLVENVEPGDEGVQINNNSFVSLTSQVIQQHFVLGRSVVRGQEPQLDNTLENPSIIRNNQI